MSVLLTRRTVVQAAIETTYNTPATVGQSDGILVSTPTYTADPNVLERNFTKATLSTTPFITGRMSAKMEFTTELRSNGKNTGILTDAPLITRLFRACGYALTANAAPVCGNVFLQGSSTNPIAWASTGSTLTNTDVISYQIKVTLGGASGTAKVTISSDTQGEASAEQVITTATPLTVGTKGLTLTPTFAGSLVAGDTYTVWVYPIGLSLDPISTGFESLTLVMHKDGVKHIMPGSYGTFEITAQAGQFASVKWTFMGTYQDATDDANPSPTFETTLPAEVQLARLQIDSFVAIVDKFTFTQANDVQIRPDVGSLEGYTGTIIVSRKPTGGIDPEADLVASYDFWGKLRAASRMPFQMKIGQDVGNRVWITAPNTQYSKMTYADRQGIVTYDAGLGFAGYTADDEIKFYIC